jgi:uncharacterized protein
MMASHVALDHVLFALLALVWPLVDWLWLYPLLSRAVAAGVPGARGRAYLVNMLTAWGLTACVIVLWMTHWRPWAALELGASTPLRLGIGFALAALYLSLAWTQRRAILARPGRLERVRRQLGSADALLPRTPGERRGFAMVAVTAGICEEVLYRGFVMWYVAAWFAPLVPHAISVALAVVISSVLFGFAHVYLGAAHVLKTAIAGLVFALIVVSAGSVWPAIIIHAAMDLLAGDLGFRALGAMPAGSSDPSAPTA